MVITLAGTACVSYHQPRYGGDGVYFDQTHHQPRTIVFADPLLYPYWSLDYFYFSRYYHPYSVLVPAWDPWFYPYPGWYYGYRPGLRSGFAFSGGFYYPWSGFGYVSYRPWRPYAVRYPHYRHHPDHGPVDRVHQIDERLRAMDERERYAVSLNPTSRPTPVPMRSEAMLRRHLAEDRATYGSRRTVPASAPSRHHESRPTSRPSATRRSPSMQSSRQRSDASRPSQSQRQLPQTHFHQGIDLSAFGAERRSAPTLHVRPTVPQSRPGSATRMPAPQSRATGTERQSDRTPVRAPESRPAPSMPIMSPPRQSPAPPSRPSIDRIQQLRNRDGR